jgi:hypothetical protein
MNKFTPLGHPNWQMIEHKRTGFERDGLPRWTPHLREVIHGEISYCMSEETPPQNEGAPALLFVRAADKLTQL